MVEERYSFIGAGSTQGGGKSIIQWFRMDWHSLHYDSNGKAKFDWSSGNYHFNIGSDLK